MLAVSGLPQGDDFNYDRNGLLITGTESTPLQKFVVEDTPASYPITVSSTKKVDSDVNLTVAIDTSLVAEYNAKNGTNFYAIPAGAAKLDNTSLTIKAGTAISTAANVEMTSTDATQVGNTLFGDNHIHVVLGVVVVTNHRNNRTDGTVLCNRRTDRKSVV